MGLSLVDKKARGQPLLGVEAEEGLGEVLGGCGDDGSGLGDGWHFSLDFIKHLLARNPRKLLSKLPFKFRCLKH